MRLAGSPFAAVDFITGMAFPQRKHQPVLPVVRLQNFGSRLLFPNFSLVVTFPPWRKAESPRLPLFDLSSTTSFVFNSFSSPNPLANNASSMSLFTSNRFLIAVLVVGLGAAYFSIPATLQQVKDAARAPPPEPRPPTKRLQKDSENSLKIDTLRTLADGYSYELRTSAIKIVASRTVRCRAKGLLLRDLASKDYSRRDHAINGLWMLLYHPSLSETKVSSEFEDHTTIKAIVRALINVLPLHNVSSNSKGKDREESNRLPPSPVRPLHRPAHELSLLIMLNNVLQAMNRRSTRSTVSAAVYSALKSGLVTRWLANYPFPCTLPENSGLNFKRSDVSRLFDRMAWMTDDPVMADIILEVMQYPLGRKQMRDVGLSASSYKENVDRHVWDSGWGESNWADADENNDVRMIHGEDTAGVAPRDYITVWEETIRPTRPRPRAVVRLRSAERSQEEEHLRRRHREAIVVAERGTPLRRENILQRENSQILQPMNGVSEVEGVLNGLLGLSDGTVHEEPESSAEALHTTPEQDGRAAVEMDRAMDIHEIEQMIEESFNDPEVRRAIQTLSQSNDSVTIVLTDSTQARQGNPGSSHEGGGQGQPG